MQRKDRATARLRELLAAPSPSTRLRAALAAGTEPDPAFVPILIQQCAHEADFFVRDMLTWALTRHDEDATVELLRVELSSPIPQARSQALHTLSKIGASRTWEAITADLLQDEDAETARTAWRTAVALVPRGGEGRLADTLASQFGRGDRDLQLSLSLALVALGPAAVPVTAEAATSPVPAVRRHALATGYLLRHRDEATGRGALWLWDDDAPLQDPEREPRRDADR